MEVFRLASKAADAAAVNGKGGGDDEEGRCIDALQHLKSFPVTTQVLVSTQAYPFSSSLFLICMCLRSSFLCYDHGFKNS